MFLRNDSNHLPDVAVDRPASGHPLILRQYRLFEPLSEGVILLNALWCVTYLNPAAAAILQCEQTTTLGMPLLDAAPALQQTSLEQILQTVLETQRPQTSELSSPALPCALRIHIEATEEGVCLYLRPASGTHTTPTSVERPSETEQEFRSLFELSAVGKVQVDPQNHRFMRVNEKFCEITGYTAEELRNMTFSELTFADDRAADQERYLRSLHNKESRWSSEKRHVHKNGQLIWVHVDGSIIRDAQGHPLFSMAAVLDITQHKQAEDALRASEARLASVLTASPVGIALLDTDLCYLQINEALARMHNLPVSAHLGRPLRAVLGDARANTVETLFRQVLKTGEPILDHESSVVIDGELRALLAQYVPVYDPVTGVLTGVSSVVADISERKRVENELRAREEFTRRVTDIAPCILYIYDLVERRNIWGNRETFEILGYSREELDLLGDDLMKKLLHPDDFVLYGGYAAQLLSLQDDEAAEFEYRMRNASGGWTWLYSRDMIFRRAEDGTPLQIVGAALDITERKRHEDALRQSEERLRLALDAVNGFVFDHDLQTDIVYRSQGLQQMLGFAPEEVPPTAQWWVDQMHPEDRERLKAQLPMMHQTGTTYHEAYRVRHRDGYYLYVFEHGTIRRDERGYIQRISGTTIDITAQKQAQQVILDLNIRLQRAVAETHHRVKNNLQTLSALVEMQMLNATATVPASHLERIGQHIRSLATLHDFLTQGVKADASQEMISLKSALERLVPLLQSATDTRRVQIDAEEVYGNLKQCGSFVLLVNELVSNALKHAAGDVMVSLCRVESAESPQVRLEVRDDGPGFPAGFDPATAANTGLELVESLARWDLRGQTSYENQAQGGGKVVVTFPLLPTVEQPL